MFNVDVVGEGKEEESERDKVNKNALSLCQQAFRKFDEKKFFFVFGELHKQKKYDEHFYFADARGREEKKVEQLCSLHSKRAKNFMHHKKRKMLFFAHKNSIFFAPIHNALTNEEKCND
jgi:hypothetical protein